MKLLLVYVAAAQFIYSRRDHPSSFAETEEYGYKDTEHNNDSIASHHLTGVKKGQYTQMITT